MWKQLVTPNLDDKNFVVHHLNGSILLSWLGWCLAVTQKQFGVAPFARTAQQAWEWNKDKHADYDLPNGMFVPIFWTGDYNSWGHIAVALREGDNIKIWSSPYSRKPYLDYFEGEITATIGRISRIYGMKWYVGWSTMLNNTRVIEWVEAPKPKPTKSNEEVCAEIWAGKWGNGKDRWNRLKEAGYDPAVIQGMIDKGVGKPAPKPENPPKPKEEPKPESPKESESVPEAPSEPQDEQKPEDKKDVTSEPQDSTPVPQSEPESPVQPEGSIPMPVPPQLDKKLKANGDIITMILDIIKMIIRVLSTKKGEFK